MQRKSLIIVTIIGVFLFITASAVHACGPGFGRNRGHGFEGTGRGKDACINDLNLTSDQISKFREIREDHLNKMQDLRGKWADSRAKERPLLSKEKLDQAEADALIQQGAELWKEQAKERLDYKQKILGILTQEQKDRLYMCRNFPQNWQ